MSNSWAFSSVLVYLFCTGCRSTAAFSLKVSLTSRFVLRASRLSSSTPNGRFDRSTRVARQAPWFVTTLLKSTSESQADASEGFFRYKPEDFTLEVFEKIEDDVVELKSFQQAMEEYLETPSYAATKEDVKLSGRVDYRIEQLAQEEEKSKKPASLPRIAAIDFEVANTEMKFTHDLFKFQERVEALFRWHNGEKKTHLGPYFVVVQSSGSGKTKLLYECKDRYSNATASDSDTDNTDPDADTTNPNPDTSHAETGRKVFLICCVETDTVDPGDKSFFDGWLFATSAKPDDGQGGLIRTQLDDFVAKAGDAKEVVFLFDEAQHLLRSNEGFPFRCVRKWLRFNGSKKNVVAVFAGTSSKLSNFLKPDPEVSTSSREPKGTFNKGTQLYDPFYELCTFGLGKDFIQYDYPDGYVWNDLDRAVKYGRPLFALLAAKKPLDDQVLSAIRERILLDQSLSGDLREASCLSVLGTRVQMGQTSIQIASDMVASGYASLTHTYSTEGVDIAHICFFPDPVCAQVTMNVMAGEDAQGPVNEFGPKFWTRKATRLFSTGLCRPDKGGVGEVTAALYLLFCGDAVRKAIDKRMKTFAVPLHDLFQQAVQPSEVHRLIKAPPDSFSRPYVSFIQVCRNYLGHDIDELTDQGYLEEWFEAGLAIYMYENHEAYDIMAPVRVNGTKFVPMLVSVKNTAAYENKKVATNFRSMVNEIERTKSKIGIAVMLFTGLQYDVLKSADTCASIADKFKNWKADSVLRITIAVPRSDCFGCWDMATQASTGGGKGAEIYASHFFAHQTSGSGPPFALKKLTVNGTLADQKKLGDLIDAYGNITSA